MKNVRAGKRITPVLLLIGVIGAGTIVALAQGGGKAKSDLVVKATTDKGAAPAVKMVAMAERKPLDYYTKVVKTDLFTAPANPEAKPKPVAKPVVVAALPTAPAIINPFADYTYSGTVTVGEQTMALVENTKTRDGQYLEEGDSFVGGTVSNIGPRTLTVNVA